MSKSEQAVPPAQRVLARLTGARLCFGRPVEVKGRTVIPVASVRTAGGYGFGSEPPGSERSGGGGGPEGTRFEPIDDGRAALRTIAAGSFAVLVVGRALVRRRSRALNGVPSRLRLRRGAHASQES